jgi:two-component system nitrogen regulation response regulator GlnG
MMEREEIPRKTLSPDAIERLENYSWPGNVRELENVIRRVALLSHKRILTAAEFSLYGIPFEVKPPSLSQTKPESFSLRIEEELKPWLSRLFHGDDQNAWDLVLGEVEEVLLRLTLELCRGNQVKASRFLGINRNTLRSKLTQYKLDPYKFRRREGG